MKNKVFIAVTIILSLIIIGLSSFIVYDKVLKNDTKKTENKVDKKTTKEEVKEKEIDVNSDVVKNLIYPNMGLKVFDISGKFVPLDEDISIDDYSMGDKIIMAYKASGLTSSGESKKCPDYTQDHQVYCSEYSGETIKNYFIKMFGPDAEYNPEMAGKDIKYQFCDVPTNYSKDKDVFYGYQGCGGISAYVQTFYQAYKAIEKEDYLYVYDYAMIYLDPSDWGFQSKIFKDYDSFNEYYEEITNKNSSSNISPTISLTDAEKQFNELVESKALNTYVWTFKKQSDGKYYYDSSKWLEE